eukprot:TRINITY_DN70573_c0_g1_i1.p1 TRINITY_DN70573_c0_g1~~TRINITY_DN70573_c0_g1_i1.p1  ORF type:complete len:399 (+),score=127.31 TRINITY_DN70573_c0_g1_i1:76-1197(+)
MTQSQGQGGSNVRTCAREPLLQRGARETLEASDAADVIACAKEQCSFLGWRLREELDALRQQWVVVVVVVVVLVYGILMVFLNLAYYRYGKAYEPHNVTQCFQALEADPTKTLCVPRRLHDLGYDIVPELSQHAKDHLTSIPMYVIFIVVALMVVFLCMPPRRTSSTLPSPRSPRCDSPTGEWQKPLVVNAVRRVGVVFAIGHTLRACTYMATSIPGAADHCLIDEKIDPPTLAQCFYKTASTEKNCGDLVFSGHMLICILLVLAVNRYGAAAFELQRTAHRCLVGFLFLAAIAQTYMILGARHHYTVDVVCAWYVTPMLWHVHNSEAPADVEPDVAAIARRVLSKKLNEVSEEAIMVDRRPTADSERPIRVC